MYGLTTAYIPTVMEKFCAEHSASNHNIFYTQNIGFLDQYTGC